MIANGLSRGLFCILATRFLLVWFVSVSAAESQTVQAVPVQSFLRFVFIGNWLTPDHRWQFVMSANRDEIAQLSQDKEETSGFSSFQAFPAPAVGLVPLYRYVRISDGNHFFTTNKTEGDLAVPHFGYLPEGACCYIAPNQLPDTVPLLRLVGPHNQFAYGTEPFWDFNAVATEGFVWPNTFDFPTLPVPNSPQLIGAVPLVSLRSQDGKNRWLITISDQEIRDLGARPEWKVVNQPPVYVYPQHVEGSIALHRYLNPVTLDHIFSLTSIPPNYTDEGVCCYVTKDINGTIPLVSLTNGFQHMYSTFDDVTKEAQNDWGFRFENGDVRVWQMTPTGAPPPRQPWVFPFVHLPAR